MRGVQQGGDRQDLHEKIRVLAIEVGRRMKEEGVPNPLVGMIQQDPAFAFIHGELDSMLSHVRFVGRSPEQVDEFLCEVVEPLIGDSETVFEDEVRV